MKHLTLILLFLFPLLVTAQTILLEEDVAADTVPKTVGPNLKHFTHSYMSYGVPIGTSALIVNHLQSFDFNSGLRYKNKISEHYSVGLNLAYNVQSYRINSPTTTVAIYDKEKLTVNNLELEIFNRLGFGKRGNIIGKYVDFGAYGSYVFTSKYYQRIENINFPQGISKYEETIYKNLSSVNRFNYGITLRLGWQWLAIYGKYRFSNLFNSNLGDTPNMAVGVELSIIN